MWAVVALTLTHFSATGLPYAAAQPVSPETAAMMVLDSARRVYNEGKYPFAADRFREFLRQYGGHKDAPAAQYGLALALLESSPKDYPDAIAALQQVVGRQDFADRPFALYYLGAAQRRQGYLALEQAAAKPNEAGNYTNQAKQAFDQALPNFTAAAEAFTTRLQAPPAPPVIPLDPDWAAHARCARCEMLLRLDRHKEAADLAKAFLADKATETSRFRLLATYQLGFASFALKDYLAAGRALSQLVPFQQDFGLHARYLLARTHHLAEERPEATAQYKAVLADFEQQKKAAVEALKNPNALTPDDRTRLDALAKNPPPEFVQRAAFYTAWLLAEAGQYGPALDGFAVLMQYPKSPLTEETQLRQGYCYLQLRNYPAALQALAPLHKHPDLSDRALWWTARATAGAADPLNAQATEQALRSAIELLNRAADRANDLGRTDPEAKLRRGDILLEAGDTQQLAKQYREAVATYQKALAENNNPDRAEETLQRLATALHLNKQFKESDEICVRFEQTYPKSTLLAAVWFRAAENANLTALAAADDPNMRTRRPEVDRLSDEAIRRYQRLLQKYPEYTYVSLARHGLATAFYQRGLYADAITTLSAIAESDWNGDLAGVPYLMADCFLRDLPSETNDALQAAKLIDRAEQAGKLLEKFIAAQGPNPQTANPLTPDALLKLGYCHQRIGALLIDAPERQKRLTLARETYEKLMQQFGQSPAMPVAVFERAKCLALLNDINGAINEFNRFQADPLRSSPVAPLALMRSATLLRTQNRLTDAVNVMAQCRQYEGGLQNDPERSAWVPLIQYEHALAVKESGKLAEARGLFEGITRQFANRPEAANALWRAGQCRREELLATVATARETVSKPGLKPEQLTASIQAIDQSLAGLRQTAEFFKAEAAKLQPPAAGSEAHLRMLYEAAWSYRALAEAEIEAARQKLQAQALEKTLANLRKQQPNQPPPALNPPEIVLTTIPLQPSEQAARDQYNALLAVGRDVTLAARARLELAELLAQRSEHDRALELLAAALQSNPPLELADRIHLRIAVCLLAKNDPQAALGQIQAVQRNAASPLAAEARCLAGEAYAQAKDWNQAIEQLRPFRDQDPFRNLPGLSDRALLRMGQALAEAHRWDESRQTLEALTQRFGQSPWVHEARYGIGWAWQNQNQFDQAANAYAEVTRGTTAQVAAQAQLQMGRCRLLQKRFPEAAKDLLVVPSTYDYAEPSAAALYEAGQAHLEMKQPAEAAKLWQAVTRDYASSRWADSARQRLPAVQN
jgi:tetratricopeptide (TPR) repeat protein